MRYLTLCIIVSIALAPLSADAGTVRVRSHGFSALFPAKPVVARRLGLLRDGNGRTVSKLVTYTDDALPLQYAFVGVDTADRPIQLDAGHAVAAEMPAGHAGLPFRLTVTSDREAKLDGYPAQFLTYSGFETVDGSDYRVRGDGVVVFLQADRPRVYTAIALVADGATATQIAQMRKFFASFHIPPADGITVPGHLHFVLIVLFALAVLAALIIARARRKRPPP